MSRGKLLLLAGLLLRNGLVLIGGLLLKGALDGRTKIDSVLEKSL